jgi:hypothetical protein
MKGKRIFVVVLALMMVLSMSLGVAYGVEDSAGNVRAGAHNRGNDDEVNANGSGGALGENHNRGEVKAVNAAIAELSAEKRALQIQIRENRQLLENAAEDEDTSELEAEIAELGEQIRATMAERLMFVKGEYTEEELEQYRNASENIRARHKNANVLGLDSVMIGKTIIKFDSAPFIKGGRTLIPVRAITEGLGAEVVWNEEEQTVTISKDGQEIVLTVGSDVVLVNGEEVVLDALTEITNNRTYVPLRFIAETFGLEVEWDADNECIEIDAEEPEVEVAKARHPSRS